MLNVWTPIPMCGEGMFSLNIAKQLSVSSWVSYNSDILGARIATGGQMSLGLMLPAPLSQQNTEVGSQNKCLLSEHQWSEKTVVNTSKNCLTFSDQLRYLRSQRLHDVPKVCSGLPWRPPLSSHLLWHHWSGNSGGVTWENAKWQSLWLASIYKVIF